MHKSKLSAWTVVYLFKNILHLRWSFSIHIVKLHSHLSDDVNIDDVYEEGGPLYFILDLQPDEESLFFKILFFGVSTKPVPCYAAFQML